MANRSDDFNRSDGSIGTPSDGGSAWVVGAGTWAVLSNTGRESANGAQAIAYLEASSADVEVQFTASTSGNAYGPMARYADNNNHLVVVVEPGSTRARMYKKISGAFTQLGSTHSGAYSNGDVLLFSCNGSSLEFKQNGVSRITATDAALNTNTKHGLRNNVDTTTRYDDFSITDLAGGGGGSANAWYYRFQQEAAA